MKEVKSIELVFENTEYLHIKKGIGKFFIGDLESCVRKCGADQICLSTLAKEVYFQVSGEAELEPHFFDDSEPFKRVHQFNDISHIIVCYEDGSSDDYLLDYEGVEENANQMSLISESGNLYVVVAKGKGIGDYFDLEKDDKEISFTLEEPTKAKRLFLNKGYTVLTDYDDYYSIIKNKVNFVLTPIEFDVNIIDDEVTTIRVPLEVMFEFFYLPYEFDYLNKDLLNIDIKSFNPNIQNSHQLEYLDKRMSIDFSLYEKSLTVTDRRSGKCAIIDVEEMHSFMWIATEMNPKIIPGN